MKNLFNLLLLIIPFVLSAQNSGTVKYSETLNMNLEGIELEGGGIDTDELLAMMPEKIEKETILSFTSSKSLYQDVKKEKATNQNLGAGISFNITDEDIYIYYDVNKKESLNKTDFFGRDFIVLTQGESKWKITKEQKMIQGFLCFKAVKGETKDKEIVIWFTPQVKVDAAPAGIVDVPGLVLRAEKDEGKLIIEAMEVKLGEVDEAKIIAPTKGKRVTQEKMEKIQKKKIEEMKSQFQGGGSMMIISK